MQAMKEILTPSTGALAVDPTSGSVVAELMTPTERLIPEPDTTVPPFTALLLLFKLGPSAPVDEPEDD